MIFYMIMSYIHTLIDGTEAPFPTGKAVCVGWNYVEHMEELDEDTSVPPVIFMKPNDALCNLLDPIKLPDTEYKCDFETELSLLIGEKISRATPEEVMEKVAGIGISIDLTLRKLQRKLQKKGAPWEICKAFDKSLPLSPFIPLSEFPDFKDIQFTMTIDGQVRQKGDTQLMRWGIGDLLAYISESFTLNPGDVVLTGSPKGSDVLYPGMKLTLKMGTHEFQTEVSEEKS